MDVLLEWSRDNYTLQPQGAKMLRDDLLVPYRKAKIAELTGVEKQKRKAKFIYDLYDVSAFQGIGNCRREDLNAIISFSRTMASRNLTAIRYSRTLSSRRFS